MKNLKHVGRLKNNKRKLLVPYRTIPNDPYHCLVIFTDTLSADEHDSLIRVVESAAGQQAYELAEVLHRSFLPDGRNMLTGFYKTGKLQKISTSDVEMVPDTRSSISLDELNKIIAEQRGIALEDLSLKPENNSSSASSSDTVQQAIDQATAVNHSTEAHTSAHTSDAQDSVTDNVVAQPLSNEDLARKYRGDADRLSKEAAQLRRMADELVPRKKPTTSVKKPTVKKKESV